MTSGKRFTLGTVGALIAGLCVIAGCQREQEKVAPQPQSPTGVVLLTNNGSVRVYAWHDPARKCDYLVFVGPGGSSITALPRSRLGSQISCES
jgi:hypothetical protein